ncbi:MAG TPA: restriction endonuclease subunit S [Flavobacteriaceae bacterium]|nr:restriction endonuclease subunit S [Flavobacteriaceae bacterium]
MKEKLSLPKGWELKTIGDVCVSASSNVSQNKLADDEGDYPIFGASGLIKKVSFYHQDKPYLSIVKDGSGFGRITKMDAFTSVIGTLQYILPKENIDLDYLNYSLMSVDFKKYVAGAAIPHIYFKDYKNEPFLWMPLPEQQRIVSILDEAFAAIAKAKANAEQNLKNAKELFESYLQGVFEKKGDGWEERKVNEIGNAQTGTTPKTAEKENYGDFIPFVKPADVDFSGIGDIRYDNEGLSEIGLKKGRKMESGSILMVCIGATIGKVGIAEREVSCNQQINSLTVKKEFEPKFIYYAMTSKAFQEKVLLEGKGAQATLPIINKSKWENLTISFPKSKTEQKLFVEKFDALSIESQKLQEIYLNKIADLEELKKSILQKAFAGELKTEKAVAV